MKKFSFNFHLQNRKHNTAVPYLLCTLKSLRYSAGIFKQSMGARNRVGPARQSTQPGGIGSLESILGLFKSLKIWAQDAARKSTMKDLNNRLVGYIEKVNIVKKL
jgi:hypothetical protein